MQASLGCLYTFSQRSRVTLDLETTPTRYRRGQTVVVVDGARIDVPSRRLHARRISRAGHNHCVTVRTPLLLHTLFRYDRWF